MNYSQICNYLMKHRYPVLNSRPDLKGYDGEVQRGFALGYVFNRPSAQLKYNTEPFVKCNKLKWKNNRDLFHITCNFFKNHYPRDFKFSTIQYNNPTYYDIKHKFLRFNGSKFYHEVEAYQGNRLTLVFFNLLEGTDQEDLLI